MRANPCKTLVGSFCFISRDGRTKCDENEFALGKGVWRTLLAIIALACVQGVLDVASSAKKVL